MKTIVLKKITAAIILSLSGLGVMAQNTSVSGKTVDQEGKNLDYVTVSLLSVKDSSILKTALTGVDGKYAFNNVNNGTYLVSARLFGFKDYYSAPFTANSTNITLEDIKMAMATKDLKEVTIVAKRPLIERKVDRLVMNVENSTLSTGSTALEVLEKAPGVTVDHNDNISMQGKQGVNVMLDGKMTYMSNADVVNMLKSMPSNEIETIELITNPSSKYDASGNAGIINIKRKKGKGLGTNGSANMGFCYSPNYRGNGGFSLNNRSKKANIFGSYNYNYRESEQDLQINRVALNSINSTYFSQLAEMDRTNENNSLKLGADFFLNKKSTLGLLVNAYRSGGDEDNINDTFVGHSFAQRDSSINVISTNDRKYRNNSYNINYKTTLDSLGQELSLDADYSNYFGREQGEYNNQFFKQDGSTLKSPWYFRNSSPSKINIAAFKADYVKPLGKNSKLEAGIKNSWVTTDNDFQFTQKTNGNWDNDTKRSNHFIYDENVNAAYVSLNTSYKKIEMQFGLRAEQTNSRGDLVTTDSVVKRSYINFFPTVFFSKSLGKNHDLSLSYSRRIDRPDYDALNPFEFYLDQYTFQRGNPFLNPQFTNSYELAYTFKKQYSLTLGYSLTNDMITQVILSDDASKSMFQTNVNLDKQINYSANLNIPITVAKWWNMNNNFNAFYLGFKSANLENQIVNNGKTAVQLNNQNNFVISKTFGAELSGNYASPMEYGIIKINAQYAINVGFSKSFMNKKMNLKFVLNDVFDTRKQKVESAYPWLRFDLVQKNDTRFGNLSLSYKFGKNDIKPSRRRATGLESEQGRLKN